MSTYIKPTNLLIIILLIFPLFNGFSQSNNMMGSLNASGDDALGSSGSVSYSIGQVFFSYIGEPVYNVAQGIQHSIAEETEEVDTPEDTNNPDVISPEIEVVVYPNPTTDYVNLSMKGIELSTQLSSYQLFNYQGKLLKQQTINQVNTEISLSNLSSSIYLLQVFVDEKILKTFKILKK